MKTIVSLLILTSLLSAKMVVVTNKNSNFDSASKDIIQYLYLAKTAKINNTKVEPLLSNDEKLHNNFCNGILCRSESQYNSYWTRLAFTGRKSIPKRYEFTEIIKKLQEPNTIAYINKEDLKEDWKVIYEEN